MEDLADDVTNKLVLDLDDRAIADEALRDTSRACQLCSMALHSLLYAWHRLI